jgi:hypothetical protein
VTYQSHQGEELVLKPVNPKVCPEPAICYAGDQCAGWCKTQPVQQPRSPYFRQQLEGIETNT